MRVLGILGILMFLPECAAIAASIPAPPDLRIVAPSPELPGEIAAFSGVWEGRWDGTLESRLAVERIDSGSATVIYSWADSPQGRFKGGWVRVRATVLPGGKLRWGSNIQFTFEMAKDRMSIEGDRVAAGESSMVTMRKAE